MKKTIWKLFTLLLLFSFIATPTLTQAATPDADRLTTSEASMPTSGRILLDEGFEGEDFPPVGWTVYNLDGETPQWARTTTQAYSGAASAWHTFNLSVDQDGWLVTPSIDIEPNTFFSFYDYGGTMSMYSYSGVWLSSGSCDPTDGDFVELIEVDDSTMSWRQVQLNLSAYAGESACLAFVYGGENAHNWYIDDVLVKVISPILIEEGFERGFFPPPGWSVEPSSGDCDWTNESAEENKTGGTGLFAIANSDACGSGTTMDTVLWSPVLDLSDVSNVLLEFKYDYKHLGTSRADVDISVDNGITWETIWTRDASDRGPKTATLDLSEFTGSEETYLRFRYVAPSWNYWWQVDDVRVVVFDAAIQVSPESLASSQQPDTQVTLPLEIFNSGSVDLIWDIEETPGFGGGSSTAGSRQTLARVLYDNGPLVTHPGGGFGGADASTLQSSLGMNNMGFGNQFSFGNRMADDFEITHPGGWWIDDILFFSFQNFSPTAPSTITGLYYQIWDGAPDDPDSNIIWGDLITNRLVDSTWTNIYRVDETAMSGITRPIMVNTASAGLWLETGTYWLDWTTDGSLTSGPWAPPVTILGETTTGNAMQFTNAWKPALDPLSGTQQGMPFQLLGLTVCDVPGDVDWLSVSPDSGVTAPGEMDEVLVTFDSTGLSLGEYSAYLCVDSNDAVNPVVVVPVSLEVVNEPPVAENQAVETDQDTPVEITLVATDPDGDALAYMIVVEPENGTLEYEEADLPVLTYVPDEGWFGEDSFKFKANDGWEDSNIATVTITVIEVDQTFHIFMPLILR